MADPRTTPFHHTGAPGSGKGTLCKKLVEDGGLLGDEGFPSPLWFAHVSVGDMLRRLEAQGALSAEQARRTREQELLGGHELVALLKEEVAKVCAGAKPTGEGRWGEYLARLGEPVVVIDGFPRNMEQVEAFREKVMSPMQCRRPKDHRITSSGLRLELITCFLNMNTDRSLQSHCFAAVSARGCIGAVPWPA